MPYVRIRSDYKDLGQVVEGLAMAAGATVYGNWYDELAWVRNIFTLSQSDQQYDIFFMRRDSSLIADWGLAVATSLTVTGSSWRPSTFIPQQSTSGASGLVGYGIKFGIKNTSASPNTFARMRVQLMGL